MLTSGLTYGILYGQSIYTVVMTSLGLTKIFCFSVTILILILSLFIDDGLESGGLNVLYNITDNYYN